MLQDPINIGLGDGLVPAMWQAITQTHIYQVIYWLMASPGANG